MPVAPECDVCHLTLIEVAGFHLILVEEVGQLLVELGGSPVRECVDEEASQKRGCNGQKNTPEQVLDACGCTQHSLLRPAPRPGDGQYSVSPVAAASPCNAALLSRGHCSSTGDHSNGQAQTS